jgi:protein-L-isoaspartate(D-aspartate) O-methyltransferase
MRVHRFPWWHDGDQEFLSEWVDPSSALDYRATRRLQRELFDPIVRAIPSRFLYRGASRDYFMRAIDEQVELTQPRRTLHQMGLLHLWSELVETPLPIDDPELAMAARARREQTVRFECSARLRAALIEVARERFVPAEEIARSAEDIPLALTEDGKSTISALHAYATSFDALELAEGDSVVELGAGTGYGCAIAKHVVGDRGKVLGVEIVPELVERASRTIPSCVVCADAHDVDLWRGASKVSVTFAVDEIPQAWLDALAIGGKLVAPVGDPQTLTLFSKREDASVEVRPIARVRYVGDRAPR